MLASSTEPLLAVRGEIGGWYCSTCGRGYCTDSEVRNGVTAFQCDACGQHNAIPAEDVRDAAQMKKDQGRMKAVSRRTLVLAPQWDRRRVAVTSA